MRQNKGDIVQGNEVAFTFDTEGDADAAIERVVDMQLCFRVGKCQVGNVWMVIFEVRGPDFISSKRNQVANAVGKDPFEIQLKWYASFLQPVV